MTFSNVHLLPFVSALGCCHKSDVGVFQLTGAQLVGLLVLTDFYGQFPFFSVAILAIVQIVLKRKKYQRNVDKWAEECHVY